MIDEDAVYNSKISDRNYLILQIFYEILRPSDGQNYRIRYRYENAQEVMITITIVKFG